MLPLLELDSLHALQSPPGSMFRRRQSALSQAGLGTFCAASKMNGASSCFSAKLRRAAGDSMRGWSGAGVAVGMLRGAGDFPT